MPPTDNLALLGDAARYLLRSVLLVRGADLSVPTVCPDWNLGRLLGHVCGSLDEVTDLLTGGPRSAEATDTDPLSAIRTSIVDLLAAWACAETTGRCAVGELAVPAQTVAHIAAIEMVVHGWDIAQACRARRPVPSDLAAALLDVSPRLARAGAAAEVFAEPVAVSTTATPGERLLALFGRSEREISE